MEGDGIDNGSQFSINSANDAQVVHSSSTDSGINSSGSHSSQSLRQLTETRASNLELEMAQGLSNADLTQPVTSEESSIQTSQVTQEMSPTESTFQPTGIHNLGA